MSPEELKALRLQCAGRRVVVDPHRPELARWSNVPARIVTINHNGMALVEFDGADHARHDIDPHFLKQEVLS